MMRDDQTALDAQTAATLLSVGAGSDTSAFLTGWMSRS